MTKVALAKNNGIRKPRKNKYEELTRSEIAKIRERNKSEEQKKIIKEKISKTKKSQHKEAHNISISRNDIIYKQIPFLFSKGCSVNDIFIYYNQFSKDNIRRMLKEHNFKKLYRKNTNISQEQMQQWIEKWDGKLPQVSGNDTPMIML